MTGNGKVALAFHDTNDGNGTETLPVTVKADEPPKLNISEPAEGRELIADASATLDVQYSASDDFGLASVGLYRSTSEKPDAELVHDWPAAEGQRAFDGTAKVPLGKFLKPGEERVTFVLVAKDANNVTGPGVTISRPLTVSVATAERLQKQAADASAKLEAGLRALVKLQTTNLEETGAAQNATEASPAVLTALLDRQIAVGDAARELASSADSVAPEMRETLRGVGARRDAGGSALVAQRVERGGPGAGCAARGGGQDRNADPDAVAGRARQGRRRSAPGGDPKSDQRRGRVAARRARHRA